jgi:hypothetical protein
VSDESPGVAGGLLPGFAGSLAVGSQIAGYRLEEQIGQGGKAVPRAIPRAASLWRCEHLGFRREKRAARQPVLRL